MFDSCEVTKLSTQITRASFRRRSHKCEPINPAPPVTKIFFIKNDFIRHIVNKSYTAHKHKVVRGKPRTACDKDVLLVEHDFVGHTCGLAN